MGAPRFTQQQRQAIAARQGNFLVAAGAGSGKTAVLTERVYWLVVPPLDPAFDASYRASHNGDGWGPDDHEVEPVFQSWDRAPAALSELLVLTFTNKAAYEMKERVRQKIAAHAATRSRLLPALEQAAITTFDAYALELVRTYHYEIGLDEAPSIVDQTLLNVQRKRLLDEIFAERYQAVLDGKDDDFRRFVHELVLVDDKDLKKFILDIDSYADLKPDKQKFLAHYLEEAYSDAHIEALTNELLRRAKGCISRYLAGARDFASVELYDLDNTLLAPALECRDWDGFFRYASEHNLPSLPRLPKAAGEEDKALRDYLKRGCLSELKEILLGDAATLRSDYLGTRSNLATALSLARELDARLAAFKRAHACFGFADIAALARKILEQEEIRSKISARFRFLMVDEYQDTSDLQEDFIARLAHDNLFCVGDIKQSIYRFRNANPDIFTKKYNDYLEKKGGTLITLPHNFRSRKQVIDAINEMFEKIMSQQVGGVNYRSGQALEFGNHSFDATAQKESYGLVVFNFSPAKGKAEFEQEAEIIAADIRYKIDHGYLVKGSDGQPRPCAYGDFAILLAKKRPFAMYRKACNKYRIPLAVSGEDRESSPDVIVVLTNLCRLCLQLADPSQGGNAKHLFASLARSFLFALPEQEVAAAVLNGSYEKTPFYQKLKQEAGRLAGLPLGEICYFFLHEFALPARLAYLGDVSENLQRVDAFLDMAKGFSSLGWGLGEFVSYFDDMEAYEERQDIATNVLEKDTVKCMSIHASKGLQFKIVYYPILKGRFRLNPEGIGYFSAKKSTGIALPNVHALASPRPLPLLLGGEIDAREEVSERMRLWYVALTRAEEKMILLMPKPGPNEEGAPKEEKKLSSAAECRSFYDFVRLADLPLPAVDCDAADHEAINGSRAAAKASVEAEHTPAPYALAFRSLPEPPAAKPSAARASKEVGESADLGALAYGRHLHRLMELVDFKTKDVSFIASAAEKALIERVLSLPIFENSAKAKAFKEYRFVSAAGSSVIDLYLLYEDHIDLIDYKAKDIDDPAYQRQLQLYEEYLSQAYPGKRIGKYLLSLSEATLKGVS